jgi:hypothetical protein
VVSTASISARRLLIDGVKSPEITKSELNRIVDCWGDNGKWVYHGKVSSVTHKSCSVTRYSQDACEALTANNSGAFHNHYHFHWQVDENACSHPFHRWSEDKICSLLANETVMFVGDSIQEQFYMTLLASTWKYNYLENCDPSPIKSIYCGGPGGFQFKSTFIRNDYLTLITSRNNDNENAWIPLIKELGTTMIILNRGAHFRRDDELLASLRETLKYLHSNHPNVKVLYRSTAPGHMNYTGDFFDSPPLSRYEIDIGQDLHNYGDFYRQNNLTRRLLKSEFQDVIFFDVYGSTSLRADAHADALHYCLPGPIDNWVRYLYNILLLMLSVKS